MKLSIANDLKLDGRNPEFADINNPNGNVYKELFWITVTLNDGTRYDHYFITDNIKEIDALLTRMKIFIEGSDKLDLENSKVWALGTPVYGSKAYEMFGGEETLTQLELFER